MKQQVRVRLYELVSRAVDEGALMGVNRAFKHTEAPGDSWIVENVQREVMNALCEIIDFANDDV